MKVYKQEDAVVCEPQVNSLWVDTDDKVYYLHYAVDYAGQHIYQLTKLNDGCCWNRSYDKEDLVHGMLFCQCPIILYNNNIGYML